MSIACRAPAAQRARAPRYTRKFTSKSETQGIVILEAMAAGKPVIAVDASGVCDVVDNQMTECLSPLCEYLF